MFFEYDIAGRDARLRVLAFSFGRVAAGPHDVVQAIDAEAAR